MPPHWARAQEVPALAVVVVQRMLRIVVRRLRQAEARQDAALVVAAEVALVLAEFPAVWCAEDRQKGTLRLAVGDKARGQGFHQTRLRPLRLGQHSQMANHQHPVLRGALMVRLVLARQTARVQRRVVYPVAQRGWVLRPLALGRQKAIQFLLAAARELGLRQKESHLRVRRVARGAYRRETLRRVVRVLRQKEIPRVALEGLRMGFQAVAPVAWAAQLAPPHQIHWSICADHQNRACDPRSEVWDRNLRHLQVPRHFP